MTETRTFEDRIAEQLRAYAAPAARPPRREAVANAVEAARNVRGVERRSWLPTWRSNRVNTYAKFVAAAAAVLVVAVVGYQFLPRSGGVGGQPTIAPSPSPTLLARGSFAHMDWGPVEFEATREGSNVTGRMTIGLEDGTPADPEKGFVGVDFQCGRTTEDGLMAIGGYSTDGAGLTFRVHEEGTLFALVLRRGSPINGQLWGGTLENMPSTQTTDCLAYLDAWLPVARLNDPMLHELRGTVEFGP